MQEFSKVVGLVGLILIFFLGLAEAEDLIWENIGKQILDVNVVLIDGLNPKYIYLGTGKGIFKSEDSGGSWRPVSGVNKKVNFLWQDKQCTIYAATVGGLFLSPDQGKSWKRILRGRNSEENNCQTLGVSENEIYLGTGAGLFISKDGGRTWHKASGILGNTSITSTAVDPLNKIVYVVTANKVFKIKDGFQSYTEVFTTGASNINNDSEGKEEDSADEPLVTIKIRHIAVDSNAPGRVYLATDSGVYMSSDEGATWKLMSDYGLLNKKVKFLLFSKSSILYAVTQSGVFVYKDERWQELSLRLMAEDIRSLVIDNQDNLYAATDNGLFRAVQADLTFATQEIDAYFKDEPAIQELHEAAIRYAEVIDPRRIESLRKQARLKAILPDLSLDYDKTITSYSNATVTRFVVGPADWGVSLSWSLSDLIWSEQQRLIDSQVRLMVGLRNDILDEVNRLYFERRKVKIELLHLTYQDPKKIFEKKLRLAELAASLDALTGGYFSHHLKN